ncbi:CD3072 family TudS-related putative desulfidase [Salidesulfovibrio brasiliensis]|uniref:CD3072 family TudS-related putative desulfidase n=1 Tax=Salidesulfovibrio brasiliensis TaxID=221711 RepID=UPI0006CFCA29|nr:CD3072 family TudS-related putative desulfidase [Salidesulfovibrio brasiliensis]
MKRGKKICVVANCLLNANAKIQPYAFYPGANRTVIEPLLRDDVGLIQLPCPETSYLGMRRWGVTKEQLDTLAHREHCESILRAPLLEMLAYTDAGYEIESILGINGSPSCGVEMTCTGYCGGEIPQDADVLAKQQEQLRMTPGRGVFMDMLAEMLERHALKIPFKGIDEEG